MEVCNTISSPNISHTPSCGPQHGYIPPTPTFPASLPDYHPASVLDTPLEKNNQVLCDRASSIPLQGLVSIHSRLDNRAGLTACWRHAWLMPYNDFSDLSLWISMLCHRGVATAGRPSGVRAGELLGDTPAIGPPGGSRQTHFCAGTAPKNGKSWEHSPSLQKNLQRKQSRSQSGSLDRKVTSAVHTHSTGAAPFRAQSQLCTETQPHTHKGQLDNKL